MTGLVALDVVIGLVFIYLLYSLLTSLVAEIIATNLGLRARNLYSALSRMLNHQNVTAFTKTKDLSGVLDKLYRHPTIKALAPNRVFSKPSSINTDTFSRALLDTLRQGSTKEKAQNLIEGIKSYHFDPSVESYLLNLVEEASGDVEKVRASLASWFNSTMTNASEWYKRNLQVLLFFIGFLIAWFFNVNTFEITTKLSKDKEVRNKMVQLAIAYHEKTPDAQSLNLKGIVLDSTHSDQYNARLDTLLSVKKQLDIDMAEAQNILGGGTWLPDSLTLAIGKTRALPIEYKAKLLPKTARIKSNDITYTLFTFWDKLGYALRLMVVNFFGYATTAIALSLGAPFWFDILNKLMRLKTTVSHK